METLTCHWTPESGWDLPSQAADRPDLVLYFSCPETMTGEDSPVLDLVRRFPDVPVCGCSTAGEISGSRVNDRSVVAALVNFSSSTARAVAEALHDAGDSHQAGRRAGARLASPGLRHVMILSGGLAVNGTALVEGFRAVLPAGVAVTGGLAGDGDRFGKTLVGLGADIRPDQLVAIGFYGEKISVGYASRGGWEAFGPKRRITRAQGNTLFELDGQPALQLYKRYLGERAEGLPATGLLFPLGLSRPADPDHLLVRTILAIDEENQSLTFAGDMPEGADVRLMKATSVQLVEGASSAAALALPPDRSSCSLAVLVSCVGRRLVLGQRTDEELEAVTDHLPEGCPAIGFYSYGEACPCDRSGSSELHNQTMTVTLLGETA
ncbi:FIST signal transduction protein [Haloferula sargassicola]|uniref:FIST N domain protein n=1 Tax=Haloferula sargassicola TaxID=490096 RepID=A0ABP9UPS2_9BACT